jgi:hypothetical protein
MSSMMGGDSKTATPAPAQSAVRSGATGASGIGGGYSTPDYSWMNPDQSAGLAKAIPNSLEEWLKALGNAPGGASRQRDSSGSASFQQAPTAQGKHSLSIGSIISAYLGGG